MSSCVGAVYLRNDDDLGMNVTYESVNFFNCIALYGGACYIYISSEANDLRILFCSFVENRATAAKSSSSFFGGDALFLTVKTGYILNSAFKKNKGSFGSVKFCNVFDTMLRNSDRLSEKVDSAIRVVDCKFEAGADVTNSLYFTDNKSGPRVELIDCNFTGKLAKNKYYIDGELLNENYHKIKIIGCIFESKRLY